MVIISGSSIVPHWQADAADLWGIFCVGKMKVLSWRGNVPRPHFIVDYDFPAHYSGGRCKRLLVICRGVKRLLIVGRSNWSRRFSLHQVWPGLNLFSDLSAHSACSTCSHVCSCHQEWWPSALESVFATEPPLHSWHEASPGLNSGGSMAWHEPFSATLTGR